MVKQLSIFIIFLFFSLFAHGQSANPDLIVTVTGDSIQCRIINVGDDEIRFRFSSGAIISIKQNEVVSYEYNFAAFRSGRSQAKDLDTQSDRQERAPFYLSLTGGVGAFGSVSFGETDDGFALLLGADAAYFFNSWFGAGIKLNTMSAKVDFGDELTYSDMLMFYGATFHGRFGKNRFKVNVCIAAGEINWKLSNQTRYGNSIEDASHTSFAGFLSTGVSYRFTKNIGAGINLQTLTGAIKEEAQRNPAGTGVTMGIVFSF